GQMPRAFLPRIWAAVCSALRNLELGDTWFRECAPRLSRNRRLYAEAERRGQANARWFRGASGREAHRPRPLFALLLLVEYPGAQPRVLGGSHECHRLRQPAYEPSV